MPQPKKPPAALREHDVKIALSESEYQQVKTRADRLNLRPAVYCRKIALQAKINQVDPISREQWGALGRPLGNLNQIARSLNQAVSAGQKIHPDLLLQLQQELTELGKVRAQLWEGKK